MRNALLPSALLALTLLGGGVRPAAAGEGEAGASGSVPRQGEALKSYDWDAFFEPGDSWKKYEQVFVWNNDTEPETLDPAKMTGVTEHNLAMALFEGLTTLHPETLEPVPGVAEWWEVSADGTLYTFHLRKNAKWSDGSPVTAEDFRWSWERALREPECQYKEMFFPIRGAEDFVKAGEKADWKTVGVEIPDPHTMRVTLGAPTAYFLELCAFETLLPVHRASVEARPKEWTQAGKLVSNGPFQLEQWKPRDRIEMVPNAHWWNRRIVRLTRMVVNPIDDQSTTYNEYLSGGLDWIRSMPAGKVQDAQKHPDYYVQPYLGVYFFRFNVKKKPFDDVRVRRAFTQSVDKKVICEAVLKAGQIPATGVVPPGIPGYPEFEGLPYDPSKARALLAEAGYPDGKDFPEVELMFNTSESHKQVCEKLVEMWKTTLGVTISLKNQEWKTYLKETRDMNYQVVRGAWIGDYADPNTFLDMWCTDRGNNNTGWSNAAYDKLIEQAKVELDPAKRFALLQKAERIVAVDELPILPLYYYVNQGFLRPRVKGWRENIRDLHPFQYIWIDGPAAAGGK